MELISLLRTSNQLGWENCAQVAAYRLALRSGSFENDLPIRPCPVPEAIDSEALPAPLSEESWSETSRKRCLTAANSLLCGSFIWFGHERYLTGSPPDWFFDPSISQHFPGADNHWSRCNPFNGKDIKRCWELSRWSWASLLARAWRISGENRYREGLNNWSLSWCQANPINGGCNWLCGQEASIRLLHALQAWQLCDAHAQLPQITPHRADFVVSHLQRISATKRYAKAQDNNHWTSEAAALFIGGSWLSSFPNSYSQIGRRWAADGRNELEISVRRLVMPDGSFAQHSLTYHRLVLDTLALVESWRRWLKQEDFSERFGQRLVAATDWLFTFLDPVSGDGPNLGSNDGAFCYQLHDLNYRDFRPTLQLAAVLFYGHKILPSGPWDEPLNWSSLLTSRSTESNTFSQPIRLFNDGGYAKVKTNISSWALLRLPIYRFRPGHADPLHIDLWHRGVNILRDGGTYSYSANRTDLDYFSGVASHNTIQFDGNEPMPRLGRFLWGNWLQLCMATKIDNFSDGYAITAAYRCSNGRHQRKVQTNRSGLHWLIIDKCSGFKQEALLRWRLADCQWVLDGQSLISPRAILNIKCDQPISRIELVRGWESRFYGTKESLQVLEITVKTSPTKIKTTIELFE